MNADGTVDTTFSTNIISGAVHAIAELPDGKDLIGGTVANENYTPVQRLARLNSDGSLDTTFQASINNAFSRIAVTSSGLIYITGKFTQVSSTPRARIARLHSNGQLDTSFDPGLGCASEPQGLILQPSGGVLLATVNQYNGSPVSPLIRVLADGSLDSTIQVTFTNRHRIFR